MSNVVLTFKDHKVSNHDFLGAYIEAQNNQRIPDEVVFVAGAILTVGLPEFFFSFYGGLIPFFVLAGSVLAGAGLGVVTYYHKPPYLTLSLGKGIVLQRPPNKKDTTGRAA